MMVGRKRKMEAIVAWEIASSLSDFVPEIIVLGSSVSMRFKTRTSTFSLPRLLTDKAIDALEIDQQSSFPI
jgi:hypothetical protein